MAAISIAYNCFHGAKPTHAYRKDTFVATLAFRMACGEWKVKGTGKSLLKTPEFKELFLKKRGRLRESTVAFIEVPDALTMYVFEVYAAMELDCSKWNTFRTH